MTKWQNDVMLDNGLQTLPDNVNQLTACQGFPSTYEEANSQLGTGAGKVLARVVVSGADFTGPADSTDNGNGRQMLTNQKLAVPVEATGDADHWALTNTSTQTLYYVTDAVQPKTVNSGSTVDVSEFPVRLRDVTQ